jgi:hypothetical protein
MMGVGSSRHACNPETRDRDNPGPGKMCRGVLLARPRSRHPLIAIESDEDRNVKTIEMAGRHTFWVALGRLAPVPED